MKKGSKLHEEIPSWGTTWVRFIFFVGIALAVSGFWAFPVESRHGPWLLGMGIWLTALITGTTESQRALDSEPKPKTKRK